MKPFKRFACHTALVATITLVTACGGGSTGVAPPAPTPTPTTFTVSTLAGDDGQTRVDGLGAAVRFANPGAIAMDTAGNTYVFDSEVIRKVSPVGAVSTLAGGDTACHITVYTFLSIQPRSPCSVAADNAGNLYVAIMQRNVINKISPTGVVSTLAGTGTQGFADGAGSGASFASPAGVAVDGLGNVYVADSGNGAIRKISPAGVVSTLAGNGTQGFVDGTGSIAAFNYPTGLTISSSGNVYVADSGNNAIRMVTPSGVVSTVAGGGPANPGSVNGIGTAATFNTPTAVAIDTAGNLYVAETNQYAVRKIAPGAVVTTLAGGGAAGYADGLGAGARFTQPTGLATDGDGNIRVADRDNRAIRVVTPTGIVTTFVGQGPKSGLINGTGSAARFNAPAGITTDGLGNVYVADSANFVIRKITPVGAVTTLAGAGVMGGVDGSGAAARFQSPFDLATDSAGNVYVVDLYYPNAVRKISPAGVVTTLAQTVNPYWIAADGAGTLYLATFSAVFKMTPDGTVTLLAGGTASGSADGTGAQARFGNISGVAVDAAGNVYVAEEGDGNESFNVDPGKVAIRKISPQGQVTTLAKGAFGIGLGHVAVDGAGNVYALADCISSTLHSKCSRVGTSVRKVTSDGVVTSIAGSSAQGYANGPGSTALFDYLAGIAVDRTGNMFVADAFEQAIRKIGP
jgi:sugar lactone lactonase YvrE